MDWVSLVVRWVHFTAGIAWIGSSFYFIWLDRNLTVPLKSRPEVEGELWMVHSGGFYQVEKRRIGSGQMPAVLHWFKWEAAATWASGMLLLVMVYYLGGASLLIDPSVAALSRTQAIVIALGSVVGGWIAYDILWRSPLARKEWAATLVSLVLLAAVTVALFTWLSGRAAYIHVASLLGTIMVLNVWRAILPAQQQMIDATVRGETPDFSLGEQAKRRSVHNSYMTLPVLFLMISSHYPQTWGHPLGWLILLLIIGAGAMARHAMIGRGPRRLWALAPMIVCFAGALLLTTPRSARQAVPGTAAVVPRFGEVRAIVNARCLTCHSRYPTDRTYTIAPNGVVLDTPEQIVALATRIRERAVMQRTMPLNNTTGITDPERATLGRWVDAGAPRP
jgi:uncharacterized membrane protein